MGPLFGVHLEAQGVLTLAGIRRVVHISRPAEDDRPGLPARNGPQTVFAGLKGLLVHLHGPRHGHRSRSIRSRIPHLAVGHERAEQLAASGDRPAVRDRDLGIRDVLRHHRRLALAHLIEWNDGG